MNECTSRAPSDAPTACPRPGGTYGDSVTLVLVYTLTLFEYGEGKLYQPKKLLPNDLKMLLHWRMSVLSNVLWLVLKK